MEQLQNDNIKPWRATLSRIIYGSTTPAGKAFDILLIGSIILSVTVEMLDSVKSISLVYGHILRGMEWGFTILFTIEYILRIISVRKPLVYMKSFFGIVDIISVLPTYLALLIPGTQYFLVLRLLRILRIFRVLKLVQYLGEANFLLTALVASRRKITVFLYTVITLVTIIGSFMYVIEGEENGFTSIPQGIYWAIVTLTTVGYGDISPQTAIGKTIASIVMIMGYAIIAVPTGIVTVELTKAREDSQRKRQCPGCLANDHIDMARFCKYCGTKLPDVV
jgi:voltage-gated potassium channel